MNSQSKRERVIRLAASASAFLLLGAVFYLLGDLAGVPTGVRYAALMVLGSFAFWGVDALLARRFRAASTNRTTPLSERAPVESERF